MKVTSTIERTGYGISGDIGGLARKTYYTPDGRIIQAIPQIREYVKKNLKGEVIGNGVRDANLDKGWLLSPPEHPKLFCKTCDRWHDTHKEILQCARTQTRKVAMYEAQAKKEMVKESQDKDLKIAALEAQLAKLAEKVEALAGVKIG